MKITDVDALILKLPVITQDVDGTRDNVLIRIKTDENITGYGEVDSSPYVIKAIIDAQTSHGICQGLRSLLIGENPLCIEQLWRTMFTKTGYYGRFGPVLHAMSGVDLALWDIAGKARGEPVCHLLGARYRKKVMAYASTLMPQTPQMASEAATQYRNAGFRAMKFGWGPIGRDFGLDCELFSAVREGAGLDARIMIDAGQCYREKGALRVTEVLRSLNVDWLEEPLDPDDLSGYAQLSQSSFVPIAAGESESGFRAFRALIEQGRIDIVQPDLSRCGGLSEARKIAHFAEVNQRRCIPHAFKSNILLAASLHFCAATASADLIEYSMSATSIRRNLTVEKFQLEDGYLQVPEAPGLGFQIDDEAVQELLFERSGSNHVTI